MNDSPGIRPQTALVTGASGFIGSHVVRILVDQGVRVRALVQKGVPLQNLDGVDVEQVEGDLLDVASLERAVSGCDTLFHMAAIFAYWLPDPSLMYRVNVEGVGRMFAAARAAGVKKVIHTSSIAAVGTLPGEEIADETTMFNNWDTADDYILSKYIGEMEALKANAPDFPVVVVNPVFPFGSNDIAPTPTGMLIERYAKGQNPSYFGGGMNAANVKDIAWGHWLAALQGRPGERYILGGHNVTYKEFGDLVCATAGQKPPKWLVPLKPMAFMGRINEWIADHITHRPPLFADKALRYTADRCLYFDISKARRELGYEPGPLEDAVSDAVEWFLRGRDARLAGTR